MIQKDAIQSKNLEESVVPINMEKVPPIDKLVTEPPEIPENVFIEYEKPNSSQMEPFQSTLEVNNLHTLYTFLEQNLEKQGYEDALINPDTSFMEEHIQYLQNNLDLMLSKVKTYYGGYMKEIAFHIETRKRNGLVETVDELLAHKQIVEDEISTVAQIEGDSKERKGISQNLFLSYKRGFKNGFAAITYNTILNRKPNSSAQ